jgi:zinc transporter 1
MWKVPSPHRFYADPAISMVISLIIFGGAIPLGESAACFSRHALSVSPNPH